jgi:haloalkane dehalogenase
MEHHFTIQGAEIYVKEVGAGTPMLMLHGSPDTAEMWEPLIQRLSDLGGKVRCFAPDLPGFGRSTMPDDFSLALENYADFMVQLLDALGIREPVHLVSEDFGSHYALALLVKYPARVRGVVVSNTAFHREYQWHGFARLYRVPWLGEFLLAGTSKNTLSKTLKGYAPALPEAYLDQSYAMGFGSPKVRKTILRMYRGRNPQDFAGWDEKMKALMAQKPSLVLWGDRDPFVDATFADKFGSPQVHHFPQYSHWLPLEAPALYAEKLSQWLARA